MIKYSIQRYGIVLSRLKHGEIELLRQWRNAAKISRFMEFREHISRGMQEQWFKQINNKNNYYFIIKYKNRKIGMTNLKNIDYEKGAAEGGIFIYDEAFLRTGIPYRAVCARNDFAFEFLKLEYIISHVLISNRRADRFNRSLGGRPQTGLPGSEKQPYILEKADYFNARNFFTALF